MFFHQLMIHIHFDIAFTFQLFDIMRDTLHTKADV